MNQRVAMLAPWRASTVSERAMAVTLFVLAGAGAVGFAVYMPRPGASTAAALLASIALGPLWLMVMPKTLMLAINARELRLPAAQRQIVASLWLYGVLCVALPTLALASCVGAPAPIAAMLALTCSGCFAVALLPTYQFIALGAAFFLATSGKVSFVFVGVGASGFLHWAWPLVAAFVALAAFNWRTALRSRQRRIPYWREPLAIRWRTLSEAPFRSAHQPMTDIRGCGPQAPVRSVRVALGGIHALRARGIFAIMSLIATMLIIALLLVSVVRDAGLGTAIHALLRLPAENPMLFVWLVMTFGFGFVWIIATRLQLRWNRGAERSLLGLLPGLHGQRPAGRCVLLAALWVPGCVVFVVGFIAFAVTRHQASLAVWLFLPLSVIALAAELIAFTLAALLDRLERWWWLVLGTLVVPLLLAISFALAPVGAPTWREPLLLVAGAWLLLIGWLTWTGYRGWRAFQARPNPFVSA
jgi:hypothetical protein